MRSSKQRKRSPNKMESRGICVKVFEHGETITISCTAMEARYRTGIRHQLLYCSFTEISWGVGER